MMIPLERPKTAIQTIAATEIGQTDDTADLAIIKSLTTLHIHTIEIIGKLVCLKKKKDKRLAIVLLVFFF
jgi:uncharacterized protein (UPF0261 family)